MLVRGGRALAARFAAVTVARRARRRASALTRVYLRAHYLSDVRAAPALAAAVFALLGRASRSPSPALRHNVRPEP